MRRIKAASCNGTILLLHHQEISKKSLPTQDGYCGSSELAVGSSTLALAAAGRLAAGLHEKQTPLLSELYCKLLSQQGSV
jgi:hypothetical protein